jgi:hypothetical protein
MDEAEWEAFIVVPSVGFGSLVRIHCPRVGLYFLSSIRGSEELGAANSPESCKTQTMRHPILANREVNRGHSVAEDGQGIGGGTSTNIGGTATGHWVLQRRNTEQKQPRRALSFSPHPENSERL